MFWSSKESGKMIGLWYNYLSIIATNPPSRGHLLKPCMEENVQLLYVGVVLTRL